MPNSLDSNAAATRIHLLMAVVMTASSVLSVVVVVVLLLLLLLLLVLVLVLVLVLLVLVLLVLLLPPLSAPAKDRARCAACRNASWRSAPNFSI